MPRKFAENKLLKKICEILFTFTVEITFHFDDTFFSQKTIFKIVPNLMDTLYNIHASPQKKHVMQVWGMRHVHFPIWNASVYDIWRQMCVYWQLMTFEFLFLLQMLKNYFTLCCWDNKNKSSKGNKANSNFSTFPRLWSDVIFFPSWCWLTLPILLLAQAHLLLSKATANGATVKSVYLCGEIL